MHRVFRYRWLQQSRRPHQFGAAFLILFISFPVAAFTTNVIECPNGVTPAIEGYTALYSITPPNPPPQSTPTQACEAWYYAPGPDGSKSLGSTYDPEGYAWGAMTTNLNASPLPFVIDRVNSLYTRWGINPAWQWTCDVVRSTTPHARECPSGNCMGQVLVSVVLTCNGQPTQPTYTVKLSRPDGSSEENAILDKIAPGGMTNASGPNATDSAVLIAKVYDQNNQLVPNVDVHLVTDVIANSGGHDHDDANRHQNYPGKLAPHISGGTVSPNGKELDGNTGSTGFTFTFRGPPYPNNPAGDLTITASCTGGKTCSQQGPNQVWVGIKDLLAIPESSLGLWRLSGGFNPADPGDSNNLHPNNHYVTPEAAQQLVELAANYHARFPNDPALNLNDASLERGGLFDVYSWIDADGVVHSRANEPWWTTPHREHRKGVVIDVQANGTSSAIPQRNFKVFEQLLQTSKMTYIFEGSHYHVRLLGIAQ